MRQLARRMGKTASQQEVPGRHLETEQTLYFEYEYEHNNIDSTDSWCLAGAHACGPLVAGHDHATWFAPCSAVKAVLQAKEEDVDEMEEDEEEGDEAQAEAETAKFQCRTVAQPSAMNRLRCMPQQPGIVAVWSENGAVSTLNLSKTIAELSEQDPRGKNTKGKNTKPMQVCCAQDPL